MYFVKIANITNEILSGITENLVREFSPGKIYLFGSHAWGKPTKNSDIDILIIINESNERKARRASLAYKALIDFSDISIDILVRTVAEFEPFSKVKATMQNKILNEGIVLYEQREN
ncbi:MAG: nucleotidyltransferase domain-containing protein [Bacteroidetes bacterium]|nr:MAG: nucleotidyltransferase domain-containing protein [Bacteroidota bacterium]